MEGVTQKGSAPAMNRKSRLITLHIGVCGVWCCFTGRTMVPGTWYVLLRFCTHTRYDLACAICVYVCAVRDFERAQYTFSGNTARYKTPGT